MPTQNRSRVIPVEVAERIAKRKPVTAKHSPHLIAYRSKGGTYLVASNGLQTDSMKPHDLLLVTWDDEVISLRPTTNPDLIEDVRLALEIQNSRDDDDDDDGTRFVESELNS